MPVDHCPFGHLPATRHTTSSLWRTAHRHAISASGGRLHNRIILTPTNALRAAHRNPTPLLLKARFGPFSHRWILTLHRTGAALAQRQMSVSSGESVREQSAWERRFAWSVYFAQQNMRELSDLPGLCSPPPQLGLEVRRLYRRISLGSSWRPQYYCHSPTWS